MRSSMMKRSYSLVSSMEGSWNYVIYLQNEVSDVSLEAQLFCGWSSCMGEKTSNILFMVPYPCLLRARAQRKKWSQTMSNQRFLFKNPIR